MALGTLSFNELIASFMESFVGAEDEYEDRWHGQSGLEGWSLGSGVDGYVPINSLVSAAAYTGADAGGRARAMNALSAHSRVVMANCDWPLPRPGIAPTHVRLHPTCLSPMFDLLNLRGEERYKGHKDKAGDTQLINFLTVPDRCVCLW